MLAQLPGRGLRAPAALRSAAVPIPEALLDALALLACPRCGGALALANGRAEGRAGGVASASSAVECPGCGAGWPIVDGALDLLETLGDPPDPVRKAEEPEEPRG